MRIVILFKLVVKPDTYNVETNVVLFHVVKLDTLNDDNIVALLFNDA